MHPTTPIADSEREDRSIKTHPSMAFFVGAGWPMLMLASGHFVNQATESARRAAWYESGSISFADRAAII